MRQEKKIRVSSHQKSLDLVRAWLEKTPPVFSLVQLREQCNCPRGERAPMEHGELPFIMLPLYHGQLLFLLEVPSSGGKGGRRWQASTHLLEPVPSIVSVNNSLLLICESPQTPFMPLPYCFPSPLPSLLFTALWTVRLFLCMPSEKVSWKENKMSLSQVPKFSSLTWILSICYL